MRVLGQVPKPLPVRFPGLKKTLFLQPVVLDQLGMEMNLSGPTLKEWNVTQLHGNNSILVDGTRIKLLPPEQAKNQHDEVAVVTAEEATVSAGKSILIPLVAPGMKNRGLKMTDGYLEGSEVFESSTDLHTFRCVRTKEQEDGTLIAGLWNTTDHDITVRAGLRYGTFYPADVSNPVYSINQLEPGTEELPEFLQGPTTPKNRERRIDHIVDTFKFDDNPTLKEHPEAQAKLITIILKHFELFAWDGTYGHTDLVQHEIHLKKDATPFKARYRLLNPNLEKHLDEQLEKWTKTDVIEPTSSPWSAPMVPVKKKATPGSPPKYRWCVDYRGLNARTIPDATHIGDCYANLTRLAGSKVFTTLDASGAFHQIEIEPKSRPLTAFSTHRGQFQFKRMPFGVVNGPATYARLVQLVLEGVATGHILPYLDDVLIHSPTVTSHLDAIDQVLQAHWDSGLRLNPEKCHFMKKSVTYLGHEVDERGTRPVEDYVKLVQDWPIPTTKTELRAFLGKAAYYRRFIKDFATISEPMYNQLKEEVNKGKKSNIGFESKSFRKAFEEVKTALSTAPILAHPRFDDPKSTWIVDTDWSLENNACGAVLSQVQDGIERPIAFHGVKMTKAQKNYPATKGELAAAIIGVKKFKYFLQGGTPFILRTDHKALESMKKMEHPEPIVLRWMELLSQYNFTPTYRKGSLHGNADSLSRRPGLPEMTDPIDDDNPPAAVMSISKDCITAINAAYAPEILEIATKEELKKHQGNDQEIQKALRNEKSDWNKEEMQNRNGVWMTRGNRVVLPTTLLPRAVHKAHKIAAHRGQAATLSIFQASMDSPYAKQAIETEIRHCLECQTKSLPRPQKALFRPKTAQGAFQLWSMDFVGPLPPSTQRRYTYILTMIDVFTKWPEAFPCHGPTAAVVTHHLLHDIFPRFGLPQMLHSDRGTHFTAKVVQETADKLGITTTTTPAYHPQSNPVERFNQDLGRGLSALAGRETTSWAEHVPAVLTAARITPHRGTKFSPYELVLGRKPPLARSLWPTLDWGNDVKAGDLGKLEEQAVKNMREYHQSKEKYYKGKVKGFLPGTRVCLFTPVLERGTSSKFKACLLYTSPSPRDGATSRMPSSA